MCGIIMRIQKNGAVNNDIMDIFQDQRGRGIKGFGGIYMKEDGTFKEYRATDELKALLDLKLNPAKLVLFHHRTPTSTENKINQTHPLPISNSRLKYDYFVAHNGMISNDNELKKSHEKAGFKYLTECKEKSYYGNRMEIKFNDSETLAIEVAMYIEKLRKNLRTEGSVAFIAAQVNKKTKKIINIFFGRNHQVLTMTVEKEAVTVSSEGQKKDVEPNKLFKLSIPDMKLSFEALIFKEKEVVVVKEHTEHTYITSDYPTWSIENTHYDSSLGRWAPNKGFIWDSTLRKCIPETIEVDQYYSDDEEIEALIEENQEEIEALIDEFYTDIGLDYGSTTAEEITTRIKTSLSILEDNIAKRRLEIETKKAYVQIP